MFVHNDQPSCQLIDLGLEDFQKVYQKQMKCIQMAADSEEGFLLLCEHPTVITLGRSSSEDHVLARKEDLLHKGIKIVSVNRGGDVSLHCPGQLIAYPILPLKHFKKDLRFYLYLLEQVGIDLLKSFDIVASRKKTKTGVWIDDRKIISIGIGVKKWISFHGMGINVSSDLNLFSLINPCGLDVVMTSMENIINKTLRMIDVKKKFLEVFAKNLNIQFKKGAYV